MKNFDYEPSKWVPFRNKKVLDRVRKIKKEDLTKHPNPDFKIQIIKDNEFGPRFIADILYRLKVSSDNKKKLVFILGNPDPGQRNVAHLINKFKIDCRNLYVFCMDEFANQDGDIAPEEWPYSLKYALMHNFYYKIEKNLRPPRNQFCSPSNNNLKDYGKMIADLGGADVVYGASGWTGHTACIDPAIEGSEFEGDLEKWKKMGPRIMTLNPFTIAQISLHGLFGRAGDIAAVPPKAATIGPAEIIGAKLRSDWHGLTIGGSSTSWQKFMVRLIAHGPVTPLVSGSIMQTLKTDFNIMETIAEDIEPSWDIMW